MYTNESKAIASVVNNKIAYNNAFGSGTQLLYEPSIFGVSNNIVLNSYNGINRFVFETELTGLNLINNNSNWSFVNGSGNVVATIKKVIVTDSNGNETTATVTVELNEKSDNYNLIIDVSILNIKNSDYFVNLADNVKDEIIKRTENGSICKT